jgi:aromatic-L-amino-acid decarboxylase
MELTAFYSRRPDELRRALSLVPEYLQSQEDPRAVNFMEYSLPLGRKFRALKLWFVMRYFGREGIAANLREHIRLAQDFGRWVDAHSDFERVAPAPFSVVCFRYRPKNTPSEKLDALNRQLLFAINAGGEFFLSDTVLHGQVVLHMAVGNLRTTAGHVERLWERLQEKAKTLT